MSASKKKFGKMPYLIIFTDLDGTLLDSGYSFRKALPALRLIKGKDVPLVLCSSKTKTEIDYYRKKLENDHPFVSENGGGIFIPKGYFQFKMPGLKFQIKEDEQYFVIKLGASYSELRKVLNELRFEGFDVAGFGDMSIKDVSELTGLKFSDAKMAKLREFDEPFIISRPILVKKLRQRIKSKGFNFTQGDFFHIMGDSDKGRAVEILKRLYSKQNRKIITAALGDNVNDMEMLENVDYPVIVRKRDGAYEKRLRIKNLTKADGIGPDGWNRAVIKLINTLNPDGNS
jgi:mannosyl-3-phosphoglycerate phosphatase